MREYLFTEQEKELLKHWLKTSMETKRTQKLFTRIRRINPRIVEDLKLFFKVREKLNQQQRWRLNVSKDSIYRQREEPD